MKTKTSELTGAALDWAVSLITNPEWTTEDRWYNTFGYVDTGDFDDDPYDPSYRWALGGPIIECEGIGLDQYDDYPNWFAHTPAPEIGAGTAGCYGHTPLIAAMRCFVASKLGDEVDIPEELI